MEMIIEMIEWENGDKKKKEEIREMKNKKIM